MNSDEVTEGILNAVFVLAFIAAAAFFFMEHPLLLIPLAVVGLLWSMIKEEGLVRTVLMLCGLVGVACAAWALYSYSREGKSEDGSYLFAGGATIAIVATNILQWIDHRRREARKRREALARAAKESRSTRRLYGLDVRIQRRCLADHVEVQP
jgi:4-hydroxybenzoate polyprenyltransferase